MNLAQKLESGVDVSPMKYLIARSVVIGSAHLGNYIMWYVIAVASTN